MNVAIPLDVVVGFGLALARLLGVFLFAPIFGHDLVPLRIESMS